VSIKEGYLHDYLAASFVGLALGLVVSQPAGNLIGNWGPYLAILIVAGIFGFMPGGFVAGYLNFRFHQVGENLEMAGLSAGFFTAFVYTIISFFGTLITIVLVGPLAGQLAGILLAGWVIGALFAFIFYSLGGYISGFLERRPFAMPAIFNLSRISRAPPPPPATMAQMCPTCGQPMTFVQQYGRWYCANCRKYS
jgi:hypothetical protein